MNTYYQTPAIVLGLRDEREADRVVTFYTRDFGKIKTLARGIRLIKSKLRGHIVPGALIRIAFVEGKESYHLVDAEIITDLRSVTTMSALQFLDRVISESERDEELWQFLLSWFLENKGIYHPRPDRGFSNNLDFQARVLSILGFLPRGSNPSQKEIHAALTANHLI